MRTVLHRRCVVVALALSGAGCGYSLAGRGSFLPAYIRDDRRPAVRQPDAVLRRRAALHRDGAQPSSSAAAGTRCCRRRPASTRCCAATITGLSIAPANFNEHAAGHALHHHRHHEDRVRRPQDEQDALGEPVDGVPRGVRPAGRTRRPATRRRSSARSRTRSSAWRPTSPARSSAPSSKRSSAGDGPHVPRHASHRSRSSSRSPAGRLEPRLPARRARTTTLKAQLVAAARRHRSTRTCARSTSTSCFPADQPRRGAQAVLDACCSWRARCR